MAQNQKPRIKFLKKHFLLFLAFVVTAALIVGYLKWHSHTQAPYQWLREGNTYTNAFYGLQITREERWLRYTEDDSLGVQIFLSRVFGSPVPFLFPKRNLIEFHRFGETQQLDAIVFIGPVDDLKGKPYGRSLQAYARVSLESLLAPRKIWLKNSRIELMELNGNPCAKITASYEIPKEIEVQSEFYVFIRGEKGFNIGYSAVPSEFDKYYNEAMEVIQSIRFINTERKSV